MTGDPCFLGVCFFALDPSGVKIFGFSEFLTGLALLVLAWTIADVRYRFRIQTTPLPLQLITFFVVGGVGVLALLTDLWRARGYWVPKGNLLSPAGWQALLGAAFFFTFLLWAWFAFIRPPKFSRLNASRFVAVLYHHIVKASPHELPTIADELARSSKCLVEWSSGTDALRRHRVAVNKGELANPLSKAEGLANEVLLLLADRRFCRVVVRESPATAAAFFSAMESREDFRPQLAGFAKNLLWEALLYDDSFLYHEMASYPIGLIGYERPLTSAMYSDFELIETLYSALDLDLRLKLTATQLEAYCSVVSVALNGYIAQRFGPHSTVLHRAISRIVSSASDLHKLNGIAGAIWEHESLTRLSTVVRFIVDALKALDTSELDLSLIRRRVVDERRRQRNFLDELADQIVEVIHIAARITSPRDECWTVQHNFVWGEFFRFGRGDGPASKIVAQKVRRKLYEEIRAIDKNAHYRNVPILWFCLNVLRFEKLTPSRKRHNEDALRSAVLRWTWWNFDKLYRQSPLLVEDCKIAGFSYDSDACVILRTYPADVFRSQPLVERFAVRPFLPVAPYLPSGYK